MPVPSSITELSTSSGSNSPAGSESPALIDDYLRAHGSFIATLRDEKVSKTGDETIAGTKTFSSNPVLSGGTANGVLCLNGSKVASSGSGLVFDGTNLGIGTSSPATKLAVVQSGAGTQTVLDVRNDTTGSVVGTAIKLGYGSGVSGHGSRIVNYADPTAAFAGTLAFERGSGVGSYTESMRLDANGNLGLGVTPSAWGGGVKAIQTVGASLWSSNSGNSIFTQNGYNDGTNTKYVTSNYASQYQQATGGHYWYTAPSGTAGNPISFTQAMTLDASGNLLVGTTSTSSTAPAAITVSANTGVTKSAITCIDSGTSYGAGNQYISFINSSGAGAGSIQHTAATTVNYATASDARLKKNITIATDALPVVSNIAVRAFDWKEDDAHVMFGFIAQELYTNYPDAVCVGDDGAELTNPKGTWQVDYGKLTPLLLKAIQEQQAIITELRSRIEALEAK